MSKRNKRSIKKLKPKLNPPLIKNGIRSYAMMKKDEQNNTIVEQLGSGKVNINTKIGCLCMKQISVSIQNKACTLIKSNPKCPHL